MAVPENLRVMSLRKLMRRLRKHAPLCAPVRLRQQKDPKCWGELCIGRMDTRARRGRIVGFTLVLEVRLPKGEKWDCIVHEWAHGLDRAKRHWKRPKDCHDSRFGVEWARAFRAAHGNEP